VTGVCLGIPGEVIEIRTEDGVLMGTVDFGGVRKDVCLAYVPEIGLGEYVIVHVGFAITVVHRQEAERTLDVLRAMGDAVAAELGEPLPPGRPAEHRVVAS
jgi:hydrogenase expression/formation protein HypC